MGDDGDIAVVGALGEHGVDRGSDGLLRVQRALPALHSPLRSGSAKKLSAIRSKRSLGKRQVERARPPGQNRIGDGHLQ